jgi:tetratricopeptide (TPR) repeat protein
VAIERSNTRYALGLAEAALAARRFADAERTLRGLLERAENDGATNIVMARTLLREGRAGEAKAYFHRAIYGRWGADSIARRTDARFELIALLEKTGGPELLAELLPFEDVPADSVALRRRLGALFIAAGSPARGADMLREVLRRNPDDAQAYAGMGAAALAQGNFRTARADFAQAIRLAPDDLKTSAQLAVVDTILGLDPTVRGLPAAERQRRSRELLARTLAVVSACGDTGRSAAIESAMALLAAQKPARADAIMDEMVDRSVELWNGRPATCAPNYPAERAQPLGLLLMSLSR